MKICKVESKYFAYEMEDTRFYVYDKITNALKRSKNMFNEVDNL